MADVRSAPVGATEPGAEQALAETTPQRQPDHRLAHPSQWPWLPKQVEGDLAPHPYDEVTGEVMAVGSERALDFGGLVNLMANLQRVLDREGLKMADVQKRLVLQQLKEREAHDAFGLTRERQLDIVCEVATRYLGIPQPVLRTYLHAC